MRRRSLAAGAILSALFLGACGSPAPTTAPPTTTAAEPTNTAADATTTTGRSALDEVTKRGKPTVTVPDAPATELKITDDVVGTGPALAEGDGATVHYVGYGQISKTQFDASWDSGQPFPVTLVKGALIDGWVEGLAGMKVGGRRTLIIPGVKGYGALGRLPAIQPDETLVFVVDLVSIP